MTIKLVSYYYYYYSISDLCVILNRNIIHELKLYVPVCV